MNISVCLITASTLLKSACKCLQAMRMARLKPWYLLGWRRLGYPHCNIIVHMRPTLSKVLWGQSVGRGLRAAENKESCVVIDVTSQTGQPLVLLSIYNGVYGLIVGHI